LRPLDGRGREDVVNGLALPREATERESTRRAALHARRASHTLGILHRQPLVREAHDVNALVADGRAYVAGDALGFFREDAESRETSVDVHESRERASEATPDAAAQPEIAAHSHDPGEEQVDHVVVAERDRPDRPGLEQPPIEARNGDAERRS